MPAELRLRPGLVTASASACALLAVARSPAAGADAAADRLTPKSAGPQGWSAFRRPDGSLWYVFVGRDEHGFEAQGRSGSQPPAGLDPATIPVLQPPDGAPIVAEQMAQALRHVRSARDGDRAGLLGTLSGDVAPELRLAALYRLERARAIAAAGHAAEYVGSFLAALRSLLPDPATPPDPAALRDLAAFFARDLERERTDLTIDARSAGLVELFCTAVAAADDTGARTLATGLLLWLPMARNDVAVLGDHVMLLCRKWNAGFLETVAQQARGRADRLCAAALDATEPAGFARSIVTACHAAWLADALFAHVSAHEAAVPGLRTGPLFGKLANNAEELLVRSSRAAMNWHWCFQDGAFAAHRLDVVRRMRAGGEQYGRNWAIELVENYLYYPRILLPILAAPDPGGSIDPDPVPPIALDAHAAFLRALALAD